MKILKIYATRRYYEKHFDKYNDGIKQLYGSEKYLLHKMGV